MIFRRYPMHLLRCPIEQQRSPMTCRRYPIEGQRSPMICRRYRIEWQKQHADDDEKHSTTCEKIFCGIGDQSVKIASDIP